MKEFRHLPDVTTLTFDSEKCVGCRLCTVVCPHSVFEMNGKQARLIDRNLVERRLPEVIGQAGRVEIDFARRDALGEAVGEFLQRPVGPGQGAQAGMLLCRHRRRFGKLAADDVEGCRGHPRLEGRPLWLVVRGATTQVGDHRCEN